MFLVIQKLSINSIYIGSIKRGLTQMSQSSWCLYNYLKNLPMSGIPAPSFLSRPFRRTIIITYNTKPSIPVSRKLAHIGSVVDKAW